MTDMNQTDKSNASSIGMTDRRQSLRVMDAIGLDILHDVNSAVKLKQRSLQPDSVKNRYDLAGYAEVKRQYPEVTGYIDLLEERIRQLQLDGGKLQEAPTHTVFLSSGGVAFADDRLFQPGDILSLKITLFPSLQRIECEGAVVSIGDITELVHDTQHSYRIAFTTIDEADAQLIDEHVHSLFKSIRTYPDN